VEIKEITDFSKVRKNPYANRIKKNGFSITVHYAPDDVEGIINDICDKNIDFLELDAEELQAFERFKSSNKKRA